MKIRKTATAIFLAAFILLTAGCLAFGPQIRDSLSPTARYVYPESLSIDQRLMYGLPAEAVKSDEAGRQYVLVAEVSQKYPERCYEAHSYEVGIYEIRGDTVILNYGVKTGDRVIVQDNISDGQRVIAVTSEQ